jgi:hypothetical protein
MADFFFSANGAAPGLLTLFLEGGFGCLVWEFNCIVPMAVVIFWGIQLDLFFFFGATGATPLLLTTFLESGSGC